MATVQYPSGLRTVTYGNFDGLGRPTTVSNYVTSVSYASHGAISSLSLQNGVVETTSFNNRLQVNGISAVKSSSTLLGLSYWYCPDGENGPPDSCSTNNGNPLRQSMTSPLAWTQRYNYDALNRLHMAVEGGATQSGLCPNGVTWCEQYGYDRYGNMWINDWRNRSFSPVAPTRNAYNVNATYTNQYNAQTGGNVYDHAGNLQKAPPEAAQMFYDAENRISQVQIDASMFGVQESYYYRNTRGQPDLRNHFRRVAQLSEQRKLIL